MNMTDFWFKLVDMTKSNATAFSLAGISVSEKQIFWAVIAVVILLLLLLLRNAIKWVLGVSDQPKAAKVAATDATKTVPSPLPPMTTPIAQSTASAVQPQSAPTPASSAQELLTDTSDRKRSLNEFVTPDSIHADVVKQTLNNDFPYQTLKPDASKIGQEAAPVPPATTTPTVAPVQPSTATSTPVGIPPVLPPTPPVSVPTVVATPVIDLPVQTGSPAPVALITNATPDVQVPIPATTSSAAPVPQMQTTPSNTQNAVTPAPQPTVTPPIAAKLPPLPENSLVNQMVVGVADEKSQPIKTTAFNPTDPIIP